MRVQTEEWRRFVPGVRMYKGKVTFFYNGEKLWDDEEGERLIYDERERDSWQVVMILPGVEIIPAGTFNGCFKLERVIMSDTVRRIETDAFCQCFYLKFVKLSRNLEYIGERAFWSCESLTSIFIPPSCRFIGREAFCDCKELLILGLPQNIRVGELVFQNTALIRASPIETDEDGEYEEDDDEEAVQWVKSINDEDTYALHRACSSFNPLPEIILTLVKRYGIKAMRMPNIIGITPSQYLEANTFTTISEKEIVNKYILDMMGVII